MPAAACLVPSGSRRLRHGCARVGVTGRCGSAILGGAGRRLDEVDERHAQLAQELVAHVHDLARRIDLVLAEADRGRPALELVIQDLHARVARIEDALRSREK